MFIFLISSLLWPYISSALILIVTSILLNYYYAAKTKAKIKDYQSEIAKSHSKILKLEVANEQLQQQLNQYRSNNITRVA